MKRTNPDWLQKAKSYQINPPADGSVKVVFAKSGKLPFVYAREKAG